jgi:hypothetical protein
MGIGPNLLCLLGQFTLVNVYWVDNHRQIAYFFQQSARIRDLIMYLMITSSCFRQEQVKSTLDTHGPRDAATHPTRTSIGALLMRTLDQTICTFARLALDNVVVDTAATYAADSLTLRRAAFGWSRDAGCKR